MADPTTRAASSSPVTPEATPKATVWSRVSPESQASHIEVPRSIRSEFDATRRLGAFEEMKSMYADVSLDPCWGWGWGIAGAACVIVAVAVIVTAEEGFWDEQPDTAINDKVASPEIIKNLFISASLRSLTSA